MNSVDSKTLQLFQLAELMSVAERRPDESEDLLPYLRAPDHPTHKALVGAVMALGPAATSSGWRREEEGYVVTQRIGLQAIPVRLCRRDGLQVAEDDLSSVSPLALDVLTVLVDRLQARDAGVVLMSGAEVLRAKGRRRQGADLYALEKQVGLEFERLGRLHLGTTDRPAFSITPLQGGERFVVALDGELRMLWSEAASRRLSCELLKFDHRPNRGADILARKIGLYFSLASDGKKSVARTVKALLKGIGALPDAAERAGRLADRFEEALLRLEEHGLFSISYRNADDLQTHEKGWIRKWLAAQVVARPLAS